MPDSAPLQLYWGILHCHVRSELCHRQEPFDAAQLHQLQTDIDALYAFVLADRKFDFSFYADHHNMGGMIDMGDVPNSPWRIVKQKADQYNAPGAFVAMLGYEYQDGMEYNVYLHDTDSLPLADTWPELIRQVPANHPGVLLAAHNRPSPTDWRFPRHDRFRLIEIVNDGGTFEDWANDGLAAGHDAGFIAGSDDHACRPGRFACTGVWATELSRQAIWEALAARRTVAATGVRPELFYSLNGTAMGGVVTAADHYVLQIQHRLNCQPMYVFAIADGVMLRQWNPSKGNFQINATFTAAELEAFGNLYIKIVYPDGNTVFASPTWLPGRAAWQPQPAVAVPAALPHSQASVVEEFGQRIGWHRFVNGGGLVPKHLGAQRKCRDMVMHTGPDALLVRPNGDVVAPSMDGIMAFDAATRQATLLYKFEPDDTALLVTALIETKLGILAAGYRHGNPTAFAVTGTLPDLCQQWLPIAPFLYRNRYVTPHYLASDRQMLALLAERECSLLTTDGRILAYCQDGYPAMPCAVDMAGLGCVAVLSCDGVLCCYDASAALSARLLWQIKLPQQCSAVTIMDNTIWCYNQAFQGCFSKAPITIWVVDKATGSLRQRITPDLINIRGTAIRPLDSQRFVALHNPSTKGSAVDRDTLNCSGTVCIFQT